MNIKDELQVIFRDVFFDDGLEIYDEMTAEDVEDWDSLSHMELITAIEHKFNIRFTTEEIVGAKNVGEFIRFIEVKLSERSNG